MNRLKQLLSSFGPAIIVAAVVLGPGSILTSSKVGAQFGYPAIGVILLAVVLMIATSPKRIKPTIIATHRPNRKAS